MKNFFFFQDPRGLQRHDCEEIKAKHNKFFPKITNKLEEESAEEVDSNSIEEIADEITISNSTTRQNNDDCNHIKEIYDKCFNSSIHHQIHDKTIRGIIDVSRNG
jgi:predicted house-cleaning noncanonical NTP pyrophosphatase (MazG superfamily)